MSKSVLVCLRFLLSGVGDNLKTDRDESRDMHVHLGGSGRDKEVEDVSS